jgi:hypothetical protein
VPTSNTLGVHLIIQTLKRGIISGIGGTSHEMMTDTDIEERQLNVYEQSSNIQVKRIE